ncbi:3-keto-disaccharide hydrolase [Tellurirhabdus rosea]|uniref:3-keto-disaccharide hydrolase n=1 Tax=Tellurirhabdus rosea TaxID=2674997 RepID=UPI00225A51B4|nr:DUF1080 domain-containing protein [Tellurirhabdus rosea]
MRKLTFSLLLAVTFAFTGPGKKPGKWVSLFDGKAISGWHSYQKDKVIGWMIEDGTLTSDGSGGDLVTDKDYENFELEFDFKIPPKSNSGVLYKIIESPNYERTYHSGPEYQIIDDKGFEWRDASGKLMKLNNNQLSGANYDMHDPLDMNASKAPGEWNRGRIVVNNNHVEHYLNGIKVVEYHYGSDDWKARVAKSKFASLAYATPHARGKIALQSHNPKEKVWYRNIRLREL